MSGNTPSFWISAADIMSVEVAPHSAQEAPVIRQVERCDRKLWSLALLAERASVLRPMPASSLLKLA